MALFHEYQIYGTNDEEEGQQVIPMQILALEHDIGYHGKHSKTDAFLQHLELYQVERPAIAIESHAVGWYLTAIFEKGNTPGESNDSNQGPVATDS